MKIIVCFVITIIICAACSGIKNADSYFKLGNEKYNAGFLIESLDAYNQAIKMKPYFYQAYFNRGNVKFKMGDKRGAIDDYNLALKINPEFWNAYYSRANRRYELGEKAEACRDWKQAAENGHKEAGDSYQKYCK